MKIKINNININTFEENGNLFISYTPLMELLFSKARDKYIKLYNQELASCFTKRGTVKYISMLGFIKISENCQNVKYACELKDKIFNIENKINLADKITDALKVIYEAFKCLENERTDLNRANLDQTNILHDIENCLSQEDLLKFANTLRDTRIKRRKNKENIDLIDFLLKEFSKNPLTKSRLKNIIEAYQKRVGVLEYNRNNSTYKHRKEFTPEELQEFKDKMNSKNHK